MANNKRINGIQRTADIRLAGISRQLGRNRNRRTLYGLIIAICAVSVFNAIPTHHSEFILENIESTELRLTEENTGTFELYNPLKTEFNITYYDYCPICCGQYYVEGRQPLTASGAYAVAWQTIAVDPSVIPYGTKLKIEGFDDIIFIAQDTGGAVRGNHIDIFVNSHSECYQQTITKARIEIIG